VTGYGLGPGLGPIYVAGGVNSYGQATGGYIHNPHALQQFLAGLSNAGWQYTTTTFGRETQVTYWKEGPLTGEVGVWSTRNHYAQFQNPGYDPFAYHNRPLASGAIESTSFVGAIIGMVADMISEGLQYLGVGKNTSNYIATGAVIVGSVAAGKPSFKPVSKSFLRQHGIKDIHGFKADHLLTDKGLKYFDVVRETTTKELLIINKATQQVVTGTGIIIP